MNILTSLVKFIGCMGNAILSQGNGCRSSRFPLFSGLRPNYGSTSPTQFNGRVFLNPKDFHNSPRRAYLSSMGMGLRT